MANKLIEAAKRYDSLRKTGMVKREYTREEIELCGAWIEGEVSTDAVAKGLNVEKANVPRHAAHAMRIGYISGDLCIVWKPDQRGATVGRPTGKPNYKCTPRVGKGKGKAEEDGSQE